MLSKIPAGRWTIAAIAVLFAIGAYLASYEYLNMPSFAFVAATTVSLVSGLLLLTRRLFFSSILSAAILAGLVVASRVKIQEMGVAAQAYDVVAYLRWDVLAYLSHEFPVLMLGTSAFVLVLVCLAVAAFRLDPTRISRWAAGTLLLGSAVVTYAQRDRPELHSWIVIFDNLPVTSFYLSVPAAVTVLTGGSLLQAADASGGPPFRKDFLCAENIEKPDIILVHQESATPPWFYPAIKYDRSLDSFFLSSDGKFHPLLTEIFGGGSQLTIFSALTGMSPLYFGDLFWQAVTVSTGRVEESLAQVLAKCGYETTVFFPLPRTFSETDDAFYPSAGFQNYFDMNDMGILDFRARDSRYYDQALGFLAKPGKRGPQFIFIQTQLVHAPYSDRPVADVDFGKGDIANSADVNEYIRRLAIAQKDYDDFLSSLTRRLPDRNVLIIRYGDHQPPLMADFFEKESERLKELHRAFAAKTDDPLREHYRLPLFMTFFANV
ncbi:MAG: sulfatase-like hydrolase/transferase, partial [Rhizobiaceae bacterium]